MPRPTACSFAHSLVVAVLATYVVSCSSGRQYNPVDVLKGDASTDGGGTGGSNKGNDGGGNVGDGSGPPSGGRGDATGGGGGLTGGGATNGGGASDGGQSDQGTGGGGGATAKATPGQPCKGDTECLSGHCASGVCCDTACTGTCVACTNALTVSLADGTCGPVGVGKKDPQGGCAAETTVCGKTGFCDGTGQCEFRGSTTSCGTATCMAGSYTPAAYCDGKGTCKTTPARDCKGFTCTVAAGCAIACTSDTDCTGGYCAPMASGATTRSCAVKKADGTTCGGDNECTNGHCVGGVCCQSACTTKCYACSKAATGQDDGLCKPVLAGGSSQGMCTMSGGECGQDGTCDGNGGCRSAKQGTSCGTKAPSCTATNASAAAPVCNGAGACSSPSSQPCGTLQCNPTTGTCKQACAGDGDCAAGNYCNGTACVPKKGPRGACAAAHECANGTCSADGHCCDSACSGSCFSCSTGTCTAKSGNPNTNSACSNACVDLTKDPKNCGTCGHDCGGGSCNGGQCQASCGGATPNPCGATACVNLQTDAANCGTCGHSCTGAPANGKNICSGGKCDISCNNNLTNCSGACVNTMTDNLNCGGCGKPCGGTCQSGACCTGGKFNCGGTCYDLSSDNAHCGTCDKTCNATTSKCVSGTCKALDGQPCQGASDCFSGVCRIFYKDGDGDGYPISTNLQGWCGVATSAGDSSYIPQRADNKWDCCDVASTPGASVSASANLHPDATATFWDANLMHAAEACGIQYGDTNCDGTVEQLSSKVTGCYVMDGACQEVREPAGCNRYSGCICNYDSSTNSCALYCPASGTAQCR